MVTRSLSLESDSLPSSFRAVLSPKPHTQSNPNPLLNPNTNSKSNKINNPFVSTVPVPVPAPVPVPVQPLDKIITNNRYDDIEFENINSGSGSGSTSSSVSKSDNIVTGRGSDRGSVQSSDRGSVQVSASTSSQEDSYYDENDMEAETLERREEIRNKRNKLRAIRADVYTAEGQSKRGREVKGKGRVSIPIASATTTSSTTSSSSSASKSINEIENMMENEKENEKENNFDRMHSHTHTSTPQPNTQTNTNTNTRNKIDKNDKFSNFNSNSAFNSGINSGFGSGSVSGPAGKLFSLSGELLKSLKGARVRDVVPGPILRIKKKENNQNIGNNGRVDRDQDIVQTVDLSSVPLLTAPPIEDRVEGSVVTFISPADVYTMPTTTSSTTSSSSTSTSTSTSNSDSKNNKSNNGDKNNEINGKMQRSKLRFSEEISYTDLEPNAGIDSVIEIESSIEEVEYTDVTYGKNKRSTSTGKKSKFDSDSDLNESVDGENRGSGRGSDEDDFPEINRESKPRFVSGSDTFSRGVGLGQGLNQVSKLKSISNSELELNSNSNSNLNSNTELGFDSDSVQAQDTAGLGGLRFGPRSPSMSSVMSAAVEMTNEFTALKNDLGDLDDPNVRKCFNLI